MFKRANKITSLLVTAAAVMSLVPAYAADVKKIDSQDGTVYNAVAYKDGQVYIDGEVNDKDEAAYYVANGKYTSLSDIDAGSDVATYGTKYVDVQDGDYYVDLTSGKVTDDSIADDAKDDASSNLRKKVKADTDGRYLKDGNANAADYLQTLTSDNEIQGSKFGEIWYATKFANKDETNGYASQSASGTATLNVFTDGSGNYIDADYNLGKIKVTTTLSGASTTKTVYIDNTEDTYDTASSKVTVSAQVRQNDKILVQDKDYIYRSARVTVSVTTVAGVSVGISQIDGKDVSCSAFDPTSDAKSVSFDVIQKIAKAQNSDEIGGAKYSKTVTTYLISDDSAVDKTVFEDYKYYTVSDGKVTGYNADATTDSDNVDVRTAVLKSSDGLYYTDLGDESSDDTEVYDSTTVAIDKDVDGNLWRLSGGYVYEWDNDSDWTKVYKVDGSMDQLSVYDKNNIVAWNQDDEVYSIVGAKTTTKDTDTTDTTGTTTTTTTAAAGWVKGTDGTWSYVKAGAKVTGWYQDGATWYYLGATGTMATGWQNVGGTWYYLAESGAMATGWQNVGGTWYYLAGSGAMLANTVVDGYTLGASGAWVK